MTGAIELTDDGLVRRMAAGDEEAFTHLYRRRQGSIYRFALHMSGNTAIAEDVTQEVFMTLIRNPKRFDPARGTVGGFLFGIARNHLRKRWAQDQRLVPLVDDGEERGPQSAGAWPNGNSIRANANENGHYAELASRDEFTSMETVQRVRKAIRTLPDNYREVVVLCELEEMSYEETAAALDCPVGTVRSRLHRARAILLEKLREAHPARRASAVGE
ncbi:MAG TPA: sigma-70 family RNA polymerase sigma factor [Candidatus Acidoferrales bacterium]|nr:sigma-70 family RNA polymerase sigma factor [Candidatus Acidoferrales bacterium]